jgi:hypothetical protein
MIHREFDHYVDNSSLNGLSKKLIWEQFKK